MQLNFAREERLKRCNVFAVVAPFWELLRVVSPVSMLFQRPSHAGAWFAGPCMWVARIAFSTLGHALAFPSRPYSSLDRHSSTQKQARNSQRVSWESSIAGAESVVGAGPVPRQGRVLIAFATHILRVMIDVLVSRCKRT